LILKNITIRNFSESNLQLSDIQLVQSINPGKIGEADRFYKNQYHVVPNPTSLYGNENSTLYYYFELYNLTKIETSFYILQRKIYDDTGLLLPLIPVYNKKKKPQGESAVEVGMFNIAKLPSGAYTLSFAVLDTAGN